MVRARRQRRAEGLNRALHELRRPLQALLLLEQRSRSNGELDSGSARRGLLELAVCALEDLDAAINQRPSRPAPRRICCRELLLASVERWRPLAGQGSLRLYWDAGPAPVDGDPAQVSRALDNLLANAIEHGAPPMVVTGARVSGRLRITVANRTPAGDRRPPVDQSIGAAPAAGGDARRGHGIPLVAEVARAHGGRFALCRSGEGCVAALELPLADVAAARAA